MENDENYLSDYHEEIRDVAVESVDIADNNLATGYRYQY